MLSVSHVQYTCIHRDRCPFVRTENGNWWYVRFVFFVSRTDEACIEGNVNVNGPLVRPVQL